MITVFTPTYNREATLDRLWESLKKQDSYDFEWLIVDDGSTDKTKEKIKYFASNTTEFEIRYYYKQNGGKHRAINFGVPFARGELFFIVDSDDWLPKNSISRIAYYYDSIEDKKNFAGVAGCKYRSDGVISGETFNGEFVDATALERNKLGIKGEKAEVFVTQVLKKYPFPEFDGEKFISEAIVWNKIANDGYLMRWFNKNVYYFDYLDDGLTSNLRKNYHNNPIGYLTYVGNEIKYFKIGFIKKMVWCGKCISTVDVKEIGKSTILNCLNINNFEYFLAKLIFDIYKIMR